MAETMISMRIAIGSGKSRYAGSNGETTMGSLSSEPHAGWPPHVYGSQNGNWWKRRSVCTTTSRCVFIWSQLCPPERPRVQRERRHDQQDHRRDRERGRQSACPYQPWGRRTQVHAHFARAPSDQSAMAATLAAKSARPSQSGAARSGSGRSRAGGAHDRGHRVLVRDGLDAVGGPAGVPVLVEDDVVARAGALDPDLDRVGRPRDDARGGVRLGDVRLAPVLGIVLAVRAHAGHAPFVVAVRDVKAVVRVALERADVLEDRGSVATSQSAEPVVRRGGRRCTTWNGASWSARSGTG